MTTITAITRGHLLIEEPIRHQDHRYETASAYDVLTLQPGEYPFTLTRIDGLPWVPGKVENGFVKPGGPYYAKVSIDAIQDEHYYVNRLWTASSITHDTDMNRPTKYLVSLYAYELYSRKTLFDSKAKIVLPLRWRDDTYPPVERMEDKDYDRVLSRAIGWLKDHGHGDYTDGEHWHIWNRVNANAMGGVGGFVKAILEGH